MSIDDLKAIASVNVSEPASEFVRGADPRIPIGEPRMTTTEVDAFMRDTYARCGLAAMGVRIDHSYLEHALVVRVRMAVPSAVAVRDAEPGDLVTIGSTDCLHHSEWTRSNLSDRVRKLVTEFVMHELDESLVIDGHYYDPHMLGQRTRVPKRASSHTGGSGGVGGANNTVSTSSHTGGAGGVS